MSLPETGYDHELLYRFMHSTIFKEALSNIVVKKHLDILATICESYLRTPHKSIREPLTKKHKLTGKTLDTWCAALYEIIHVVRPLHLEFMDLYKMELGKLGSYAHFDTEYCSLPFPRGLYHQTLAEIVYHEHRTLIDTLPI